MPARNVRWSMARWSMWWVVATGLMLTCAAAPAHAQSTPITADIAADWQHPLSGATFPVRLGPAQLGAFARESMEDYGTQQLDISGTYQQPQTRTTATLYVYRAGLPDASIWHDRIKAVIAAGRLGTPDFTKAITTLFTPAGHGANSGIRSAVPMTGKTATSSGVSVFPHDDWLVVVRMTSYTLSAADLDTALAGFTAAIPLPAPKASATAAYVITPCTDPFPAQAAKRAPRDMMDDILASALMQALDDAAGKPTPAKPDAAPPAPYCADPAGSANYGAYRAGGDKASYVVAMGDAGNAVQIAPNTMAAMLDKKKAGQYSMTLSTVASRISYTPFAAIPTVAQVIAAIDHENPVASTDRPIGNAKTRNINIAPN